MDREIKFRSFCQAARKFYYFINGRYYDGENLPRCISERIIPEFYWGISEQYTGTKDLKVVEIYDGDILELHGDAVFSKIPIGFIGKVLFREGCWWVDNGDSAHRLWGETADWKIIGNIRQNLELLK